MFGVTFMSFVRAPFCSQVILSQTSNIGVLLYLWALDISVIGLSWRGGPPKHKWSVASGAIAALAAAYVSLRFPVGYRSRQGVSAGH